MTGLTYCGISHPWSAITAQVETARWPCDVFYHLKRTALTARLSKWHGVCLTISAVTWLTETWGLGRTGFRTAQIYVTPPQQHLHAVIHNCVLWVHPALSYQQWFSNWSQHAKSMWRNTAGWRTCLSTTVCMFVCALADPYPHSLADETEDICQWSLFVFVVIDCLPKMKLYSSFTLFKTQ